MVAWDTDPRNALHNTVVIEEVVAYYDDRSRSRSHLVGTAGQALPAQARKKRILRTRLTILLLGTCPNSLSKGRKWLPLPLAPWFIWNIVSTLKKSDVKRFYNHLADERGLQASTIDSVHTVLHQVLDMTVDDNYIRNNPSDNVLKELKQSHVFKTEKRRGLTKPEQDLLLEFLRNHRIHNHWYPIFAVMVGTGLRVGEVTGLRWCDIDLEEGIIDINHTLVYYRRKQRRVRKRAVSILRNSG